MSVSSLSTVSLNKELRVLICGSRNWTDKRRIGRYLDTLMDEEGYEASHITIIHGACKGADYHAGMEAKGRGMNVLEFPAKWSSLGLAAGPKRNQQMLDEGKPDRIVAFHENITSSKGTKDMVTRSEIAGLPVTIIKN